MKDGVSHSFERGAAVRAVLSSLGSGSEGGPGSRFARGVRSISVSLTNLTCTPCAHSLPVAASKISTWMVPMFLPTLMSCMNDKEKGRQVGVRAKS